VGQPCKTTREKKHARNVQSLAGWCRNATTSNGEKKSKKKKAEGQVSRKQNWQSNSANPRYCAKEEKHVKKLERRQFFNRQ